MTEGNVGEFLKFFPGIAVEYTAADVRSISVRGLDSRYTGVTVDGARQASANFGASTRSFDLYTISINNVSRVEVPAVADQWCKHSVCVRLKPTPPVPPGLVLAILCRGSFGRATAWRQFPLIDA